MKASKKPRTEGKKGCRVKKTRINGKEGEREKQ